MKKVLMMTVATLALATWAAAADDAAATPTPAASKATVGPNFVDADGDGICDHFQARSEVRGAARGRSGKRGYGPGDGTGNQGIGPRDGSGYGPGGGSGNCDGTGPKGQGRGRSGRK
jgi:hypothetical protein